MNCEEIKHLLSRYIDDQLDSSEKSGVEEHLKSCEDCSAYYQKLLALQKMANDFDISGDERYWVEQKDAVIDSIEKLESAGTTPVPSRRASNVIYKLAAVAASITLIAFISIHESKNIEQTRDLFRPEKAPARDIQYESKADLQLTDTTQTKQISYEKKAGAPVTDREPVEAQAAEQLPEVKVPARGIPEPVPIEETATEEEVVAIVPEAVIERQAAISAFPEGVVSPRPEKGEKAEVRLPEGIVPKKILAEEPLAEPQAVMDQAVRIDAVQPYQDKGPEALSVESLAGVRSVGASVEEDLMEDFDVGLQAPGVSRVELDPVLFGDFSPEEERAYSEWHDKADVLQQKYGHLLSPHMQEMAAKARRSAPSDSLNLVIVEMAETFHRLGLLTPIKEEREVMLKNLEVLRTKADPPTAQKIRVFIASVKASAN